MDESKRERTDVEVRPLRTIEQEVWLLAQPVDVNALQRQGVLIRRGDWYEIVRPSELPEHVTIKLREVRNESGRLIAQLPCSSKASQVIAECMGIDWRGPMPS